MPNPTPEEIDSAEVLLDAYEGEYSWMEDLEPKETDDDKNAE